MEPKCGTYQNKQKKKLLAMEMGCWRRCCRRTLLDRIRNEDIRTEMNIDTNILDTINAKRLRWYGHVNRMNETRLPKKILKWTPPQRRKRGRPKITWNDGVQTEMAARDLQEGDGLY